MDIILTVITADIRIIALTTTADRDITMAIGSTDTTNITIIVIKLMS